MSDVPRSRSRRRPLFAGLIVVVVAGAVVALAASLLPRGGPQGLPARVDPMLPDLTMGPIFEVYGGLAENTRDPVIRVEATIVNQGAGDFLVSARRDFPWNESWTVYQRIPEATGGFTEIATPADLIFTGAPHSHWHVRDMESHRLENRETSEILSEVIKQGFCPFDTDRYFGDLPGAPPNPVFLESACEGPAWTTELMMGVSVGWGDKYPWHMIEQSIPIKDIPDGTYRIVEVADPFDWFQESDETNNETWVDVELKREGDIPTVKIIGRAP